MASYKEYEDSERVKSEIISSSIFDFESKPFKEILLENTSSLGIDIPLIEISRSIEIILNVKSAANLPVPTEEETAIQFLFAKVYDNRNNISQLYVY